MFLDLYVMRWLSRFLKHVFPRSRSNARGYSRILSPSTSGFGLPYPTPPCTSLYPAPARPTWPFQSPHGIRNSDAGIMAFTACSWSKNRSLTSSLRPLCGAYTDRKVTTCWPTMSFTKMILSETLWTSKTFSVHSSATNMITGNNSGFFVCLFLHQNILCGSSLDLPCCAKANEYSHTIFFWAKLTKKSSSENSPHLQL